MAEFALDKAFGLLYAGVEDLIVKNFIFKSLFEDTKSRLDSLLPLINEMAQYSQQMDRPKEELGALKKVIDDGLELVRACSTVKRWNAYKKYKYARKLLEWDESLKTPLETLKVQESMHVMKIGVTVDDIHRVVLNQSAALASSTSTGTSLELPPLPRFIVGLDTPLQELKEKLVRGDDGESMLVLTAPGGCGKTTLATMFCRDQEVKESILESFQFEMSNYKIVTSRSEFPRFSSSYHLQLLDEKNALKLFYHSTSLGDGRSHELEKLSRKIVKRCNGFPLAITVVGRSLCRQPIELWRKRETEWSNGASILDSETTLFLCLQSSLDALNKETVVKDCFLDLGSFTEDKKICVADLIDMWAELYDLNDDSTCFASVYDLCNRNLATLVDERKLKMDGDYFYHDRFVTQHDLLRELAIYNNKLEPVEHRKRVNIEISGHDFPKWWRLQKDQPLQARLLSISNDSKLSTNWPNMEVPQVEVLVLDYQGAFGTLPHFVKKMDQLKVLVAKGGNGGTEIRNFVLLDSLANLKTISLECISGFLYTRWLDEPYFKQCNTLKKISFRKCDLEDIFNHRKSRDTTILRNLPELNIVDCYHCGGLFVGLQHLIHLKKLTISNCSEFEHFRYIEDLVNLEVLRVRSCIQFSQWTSIGKLIKLEILDIAGCTGVGSLPEDIGQLGNLRKLDIRKCSLQCLPQSVSDLRQLEEVICDVYTSFLWKPFQCTLKNMDLVVPRGKISTRW